MLIFTNASSANPIDRWVLSLTDLFEGWGMLIYLAITLLLSAILSAIIGLERYRMGENAGIRTHALLAVGCSLLMTISIWAIRIPDPTLDYDISRIGAAAVTGIGFLGAGVIIKNKFTVKGLSTATTLWISAAVGLANGAGFVLEAIVATIITMLVVFIRNRVIIFIDKNAPHVIVKAKRGTPLLEFIESISTKNTLNVKNIDILSMDDSYIVAEVFFPYRSSRLSLEYFMDELKKNENVLTTEIVMKRDSANQGPHES